MIFRHKSHERRQTTKPVELLAKLNAASDLQECRDRLTEWLLSARGLAIAREGESGIAQGTPLTGAQRKLIRSVEEFGYRVRIR